MVPNYHYHHHYHYTSHYHYHYHYHYHCRHHYQYHYHDHYHYDYFHHYHYYYHHYLVGKLDSFEVLVAKGGGVERPVSANFLAKSSSADVLKIPSMRLLYHGSGVSQ